MENEIWKDITNYEGIYQVSNLGRVKSLKRKLKSKKGYFQTFPEKIMKTTKRNGYKLITLSLNCKEKTFSVHRLVANAFIENPLNKEQINHIDGNKENNSIENLEWNTRSENNKHAYKIGLNVRSDKAGRAKKPVLQIKNGKIINFFETMTQAELETKTPRQNIRNVIKGKRKSANGYEWKLAK